MPATVGEQPEIPTFESTLTNCLRLDINTTDLALNRSNCKVAYTLPGVGDVHWQRYAAAPGVNLVTQFRIHWRISS